GGCWAISSAGSSKSKSESRMVKHSRDSGAGRVRQLAMRAEPVRERHRILREADEPGDAEHPDRRIEVVLESALVESALVCGQKRRDAFDTLYRDGDPAGIDAPKMLCIGLHCRLAGRPGRRRSQVSRITGKAIMMSGSAGG